MLIKIKKIWFSVIRDEECNVWIVKAINLGNTLLFNECDDLNHVQAVANDLAEGYFEMLEDGEPDRIQPLPSEALA